ncbi:MAG: alpha/beta hydrolase [Proteobacteria bacterium]|nr:alpha/beta hydrolase [Pseudomonadota bacterium]
MRAAIRDTELYFDVEGTGLRIDENGLHEKKTAFAIHGGPGGEHVELRLGFSPLSEAMQIVYFDHRGQGRSARGDRAKYNLDENVEDMEALRRHLGLGKIVTMGTSYGGMVAMAHAARYPDSVSHLILIVTASHAGFNDKALAHVRARGSAEQIAVCEDLWAGRLDTVEKVQNYYRHMGPMYSVKFDAERAAARAKHAIVSPEPLVEAFKPGGTLRRLDLRPELKNIRVPTLILAGQKDWICAPEFSEEIHALIPSSRLRIVPDCSHTMRVDAPEILRGEIRDFLGL